MPSTRELIGVIHRPTANRLPVQPKHRTILILFPRVGVTGLEPAASRTPCARATTAPHPDPKRQDVVADPHPSLVLLEGIEPSSLP
ncbi:MAG: hypothetical protein VF00_C0001G0042 [candidate division Kazan bacterium GW2011_GWB1_52_7]|uniref:Uncharacterized protein n=1 Tax=candidate division Kazan bacterium GW2011_GWB1_52_7 TaxID=1620414 RepID=A0A0G1ZGU5_UNCK3|nr:MAG: hypothetical protein VF00_C0001G0042 [candidate division Kazan bacterium GW2011_GWB1_52_7]